MANTKKILVGIMLMTVAIMATGCSDSNPVNVDNAIDTAPPATPYAVRSTLDYTTGTAVITWAVDTVDTDLAGYVVSRENDGQVVDLVANPTMVYSVQDTDPQPGINIYHVYAVDQAGNQSAVQSATLTLASSHADDELSQ